MNREEFRAFAAGTFIMQNKGQALKIEQLDAFIDGSILAFDKLTKKNLAAMSTTTQNGRPEPLPISSHGQSTYTPMPESRL